MPNDLDQCLLHNLWKSFRSTFLFFLSIVEGAIEPLTFSVCVKVCMNGLESVSHHQDLCVNCEALTFRRKRIVMNICVFCITPYVRHCNVLLWRLDHDLIRGWVSLGFICPGTSSTSHLVNIFLPVFLLLDKK
jgi:hypothetical protein